MTSSPFGFTKLLVADLEGSAEFYETVFGLQPRFRVPYAINERKLEEIIYSSESGPTLALLKFEAATQPSSDEVILGFFTDDIASTFDRAVTAGGAIVRPPRPEPEWGITVGFLADKEGHLIEVTQPF